MDYFAVGFVERVVRDVPFCGGDTGCPGALVDAVAGEFFHEFHGGVGACFVVPVAGVDEGWLGGVGHFGEVGRRWGSFWGVCGMDRGYERLLGLHLGLSGLRWSLNNHGRRRPRGTLYSSCEIRYPNWGIVCLWFTHGSCEALAMTQPMLLTTFAGQLRRSFNAS